MIHDRSDNSIPCTNDNTEKTSGVTTEIRSVSRANSSSPTSAQKTPRTIAPFIAAHDIPRGAIHASQALLSYALMLAVMYVLGRAFPF
jgi:copper transporter 1